MVIIFLKIFFSKRMTFWPLILFFRPKDWYEEPEKGDRRIKRIVNVEQCNCKREILSHTMVTYEGGDHGNSSISTCSEHSFHRGAKQKVIVFLRINVAKLCFLKKYGFIVDNNKCWICIFVSFELFLTKPWPKKIGLKYQWFKL